jgi:hypothetical protein
VRDGNGEVHGGVIEGSIGVGLSRELGIEAWTSQEVQRGEALWKKLVPEVEWKNEVVHSRAMIWFLKFLKAPSATMDM